MVQTLPRGRRSSSAAHICRSVGCLDTPRYRSSQRHTTLQRNMAQHALVVSRMAWLAAATELPEQIVPPRPEHGEYIEQERPAPWVSVRYPGHVPPLVLFRVNGSFGIPVLQAISRNNIPGMEAADARDVFSTRPVGSKVAFNITVGAATRALFSMPDVGS